MCVHTQSECGLVLLRRKCDLFRNTHDWTNCLMDLNEVEVKVIIVRLLL